MKGAGTAVFLAAGLAWAAAGREARVAADGVLRWADDGAEVALLGVNLYTPFTIDHAEVRRLGLDPRQVIRDDVAHLRRLGLGCIRVHCFERQISDAEGNLLDNEHLALLDFLIDECGRNGLYTVLTPIAWWGGGRWTEKTRGFSDVYAMRELTANRATWPIQARFLRQFAEHVNRHTGRRYADDPFVLAFESINEPLYPPGTPDSLVTEYIDTLTDALKASGTAKPVFYNSWQGRNAAAGASRADGVTCSSYPTGLVAGRTLEGPQLGRVRGSSLQPDASIAGKPRMAYEFDAADVAGSYMFPAMAKMFRAERVQVAAQFQYDLLPLADVNANWQTHHLNLVYTPGKALSLAIAAEVFARVPLGEAYAADDAALAFPPFRVSAAEDLSELVTAERYLHSNATRTPPPAAAALERVWGCGPSPVVAYDGSGAYFLDRVTPGVWRLQVYPDVFTVADPYTGSAEVKVRVLPTRRTMTVRLPDLGGTFRVRAFDGAAAGRRLATAREGAFEVTPGDYLLTRRFWMPGAATRRAAAEVAPRFVAPAPPPVSAPLLRASVPPQWRACEALELRAEAVFATNLTARLVSDGGDVREVVLAKGAGHGWAGTLPAGALAAGAWGVTFRAAGTEGAAAFPESGTFGAAWRPAAGGGTALVRVPQDEAALRAEVRVNGAAEVSLAAGPAPEGRALKLAAGAEAAQGDRAAGYALPFAAAGAEGLGMEGMGLRVVARGGGGLGTRVEIGFQMRDGRGLGCDLRFGPGWSACVVPATELKPLWGLPSAGAFRWQEVGRVSVLTGAWLWRDAEAGPQVFELASLEWVPMEPVLPLNAAGAGGRWALFDAKAWMRVPTWSVPLRRWPVKDDEGRDGVHLGMAGFGGEHGSVSLRVPCDGRTFARLWRTDGADAVLNVRARGAYAQTTAFELVLVEACGVAWGLNVPLTREWQTVRVPLRQLRLFTHWDKAMAGRAGEHLRLSRLEGVSFCFGKWLYPAAAGAAHAVEIAEISVEQGNGGR